MSDWFNEFIRNDPDIQAQLERVRGRHRRLTETGDFAAFEAEMLAEAQQLMIEDEGEEKDSPLLAYLAQLGDA